MNALDATLFCNERGRKFTDLFEKAMQDYKHPNSTKDVYTSCMSKMEQLWNEVKELFVVDHVITARQLINWFFTPDGCITFSYNDFIVYEHMYLLMCLHRGVSVCVYLDSILNAEKYPQSYYIEVD